jgi:DNA invertase Pin-like site-specific DNA recombinase
MISPETSPAPAGRTRIGDRQRDRLAIVYVRQSSVNQVQHHRESTQLQYGLVEHARRLGWEPERIAVIDDDLGLSGASAEGRPGFQRLLGEVALDHVGLVLGVEMSRLARSCKDWYQLLELCALFETLICDLDGLYDPGCYNDRLLLGLKGTMSEAELHVLRQRLWQGALQKARRGELASRGPIGYVRDGTGLAFDPDEQAQGVVRLVFERFERLGTMNAVLRELVGSGIRMPVRPASGPDKGQLSWRRPSQSALQNMLSHPAYAGAYVYGRSSQARQSGRPKRPCRLPREQWLVLLRDRHPAYISWEQYEANQERLRQNRSRYACRGSVRSGRALLAGLVVCARCGYRLRTQYGGRSSQPRYNCSANQTRLGEPRCQCLNARALDEEVVRLTFQALMPPALEVSLQVADDLHHQRDAARALWKQRLERAEYEAERAARQYRAVEPENRLVARSLEAAWEEKLRARRDLVEEHERFLSEQPRGLTEGEREQIRRLAANVPALWHAESTTDADRKAILREVIDRVEVDAEGESEWVSARIHWVGGGLSETRIRRPVQRMDQLSTWPTIRRRIEERLAEGVSAPRIAAELNAGGILTARGQPVTEGVVRSVMTREGLRSTRAVDPSDAPPLGPNEWLVGQLAAKLRVTHGTIHQWIKAGRVGARPRADGRWVVTADEATCRGLVAYRERQDRRRREHEAGRAAAKRRGEEGPGD